MNLVVKKRAYRAYCYPGNKMFRNNVCQSCNAIVDWTNPHVSFENDLCAFIYVDRIGTLVRVPSAGVKRLTPVLMYKAVKCKNRTHK